MDPHRFLDITTIPLVLPTRYPLLNGLSPVKDTLQRHTWLPIALVRYVKILTWLRGFLFIFLYLVWFSLFQVSNGNCETMESWKVAILTIQPQSHVRILIYRTWAICNFWNERGSGNEVRPAVVSGIVTGDVPVSYWPQWSSQKSFPVSFSSITKINEFQLSLWNIGTHLLPCLVSRWVIFRCCLCSCSKLITCDWILLIVVNLCCHISWRVPCIVHLSHWLSHSAEKKKNR